MLVGARRRACQKVNSIWRFFIACRADMPCKLRLARTVQIRTYGWPHFSPTQFWAKLFFPFSTCLTKHLPVLSGAMQPSYNTIPRNQNQHQIGP